MFRWLTLFSVLFIVAGFVVRNKPTPYVFTDLKFFPKMPQSMANPVTVEGADLGRHLFYDPILSLNKDRSCATCHRMEKAFSDSPNALTKGNKGVLTNRNTMPLFNLAWYSSFFWDGRAATIEEQVFHPVRNPDEMNLTWEDATKRVKKKQVL